MRISLAFLIICGLVLFLVGLSETRHSRKRGRACNSTKECRRNECCVVNPDYRGKRSLVLIIPIMRKKGRCVELGTLGTKCYMHKRLRRSRTYGEFCPCKRRLSCTHKSAGGKGPLGICSRRSGHGRRHHGRHGRWRHLKHRV